MTVREALIQQNPGALFYPDRFEAALGAKRSKSCKTS